MSPLELRWSRRHEGLQAANSHLDERLGGRKSELQMYTESSMQTGAHVSCIDNLCLLGEGMKG